MEIFRDFFSVKRHVSVYGQCTRYYLLYIYTPDPVSRRRRKRFFLLNIFFFLSPLTILMIIYDYNRHRSSHGFGGVFFSDSYRGGRRIRWFYYYVIRSVNDISTRRSCPTIFMSFPKIFWDPIKTHRWAVDFWFS